MICGQYRNMSFWVNKNIRTLDLSPVTNASKCKLQKTISKPLQGLVTSTFTRVKVNTKFHTVEQNCHKQRIQLRQQRKPMQRCHADTVYKRWNPCNLQKNGYFAHRKATESRIAPCICTCVVRPRYISLNQMIMIMIIIKFQLL